MITEQECAQLDAEGRPWIQTISGHAFPLPDPTPADFKLGDIAHALSRINRYTGHIIPENYSVAEHSIRVAFYAQELVRREQKTRDPEVLKAAFRAGLMHDAHEAYLNDLSSPLKRTLLAMGSDAFQKLAKQYDAVLAGVFALSKFSAGGHDLIKDADLSLLDLERPKVLGKPPRPWQDLGTLPKVTSPNLPEMLRYGWAPNYARAKFLKCAAACGL